MVEGWVLVLDDVLPRNVHSTDLCLRDAIIVCTIFSLGVKIILRCSV